MKWRSTALAVTEHSDQSFPNYRQAVHHNDHTRPSRRPASRSPVAQCAGRSHGTGTTTVGGTKHGRGAAQTTRNRRCARRFRAASQPPRAARGVCACLLALELEQGSSITSLPAWPPYRKFEGACDHRPRRPVGAGGRAHPRRTARSHSEVVSIHGVAHSNTTLALTTPLPFGTAAHRHTRRLIRTRQCRSARCAQVFARSANSCSDSTPLVGNAVIFGANDRVSGQVARKATFSPGRAVRSGISADVDTFAGLDHFGDRSVAGQHLDVAQRITIYHNHIGGVAGATAPSFPSIFITQAVSDVAALMASIGVNPAYSTSISNSRACHSPIGGDGESGFGTGDHAGHRRLSPCRWRAR